MRRLGLLALLVVPQVVLAADPSVRITADVVQASNESDTVDPALQPMKDKFAKSGISYRSFRKLSSEVVELRQGKPTEMKLPNGRTATLKLEELRGRKALVRVTVPPVETVYELGREGSVFVRAGKQGDGVLILVLSPPASS
jgi:hypothetical protein